MPIQSSDIKMRLSIKTGSAGNSLAQSDPNASLGKYISTTDIADNTLNNLFDNVTGDENALGDVEYRCVFFYNAHGSLTLETPRVWIGGKRCTSDGGTDVVTCVGHGFSNGHAVRVEAELPGDALPSGLGNSTTYYVRDASDDTFRLTDDPSEGAPSVNIGSSSGFAVRQYSHTSVAIGLDTNTASAVTSGSAQAVEIADEGTAPSGVSFSSPLTKNDGLSLGNLPAGQCRAVWIRRTALNNGARNNDGMNLKISGDTAE